MVSDSLLPRRAFYLVASISRSLVVFVDSKVSHLGFFDFTPFLAYLARAQPNLLVRGVRGRVSLSLGARERERVSLSLSLSLCIYV